MKHLGILLLALVASCGYAQQFWKVTSRAATPALVGGTTAALGAPATIVGVGIFTTELLLEAMDGADLQEQITDEGVRVVTKEVVKHKVPLWFWGIVVAVALAFWRIPWLRHKAIVTLKDIGDGPDDD